MNEKYLTKISLVGIVITLFLLFAVTSTISSESISIGKIDKSHVGKMVNITGEIINIHEKDGNYFLSIGDGTGSIRVVIWKDTADLIEARGFGRIENGSVINIVGTVQIYEGELEIMPVHDNIKILS